MTDGQRDFVWQMATVIIISFFNQKAFSNLYLKDRNRDVSTKLTLRNIADTLFASTRVSTNYYPDRKSNISVRICIVWKTYQILDNPSITWPIAACWYRPPFTRVHLFPKVYTQATKYRLHDNKLSGSATGNAEYLPLARTDDDGSNLSMTSPSCAVASSNHFVNEHRKQTGSTMLSPPLPSLLHHWILWCACSRACWEHALVVFVLADCYLHTSLPTLSQCACLPYTSMPL